MDQELTGRTLVLLAADAVDEGIGSMGRLAGLSVERPAADEADDALAHLGVGGGVVLDELGVAVVDADPDQLVALHGLVDDVAHAEVVAAEPERVVYAIGDAYVAGFRDGVASLATVLEARPDGAVEADGLTIAATWSDRSDLTWGLQAIGIGAATLPEVEPVLVAVLDTGIDEAHPDLAPVLAGSRSFVGEPVADRNGHGTHCAGVVAGAARPRQGPRYGVAPDHARLLAGKVLSNAGRGSDQGILAGINWAVSQGASVVSMSLGAAASVGQAHSVVYERAARRAAARGCLIVAAAGNESQRSRGVVAPVGHPANCPTILAVGAIDRHEVVADFSCGTRSAGQAVDIAGPGVGVRSAWPQPAGYRTIDGTSMATPHVAGVAAIVAATNPDATPDAWWGQICRQARRLTARSTDVGAGIAHL